jgi:hypothetical protein
MIMHRSTRPFVAILGNMGTPRLLLVVLCAVLLFPSTVFSADISASPFVIDKEAKPRDIIKGEVSLKNMTGHKVMVFPDVKDYAKDAGPGSMTSWIELSRGVIEIDPGETRAVPYLLHVNYDAKPGYYHAVMWFGTGSFRAEAESNPGRATEILVNVKVLDDAIERLQLATFIPDRQIFPTEEAQFSFGLQNTGNRLVAPGGNLRIFDRRGREIAVVPVNTEKAIIAPEGKELLAAAWNAEGMFGRYKAVLDLEYGGQSKQITDTTFFWVLPWGKTLSLFTGVSVAVVVISILIHARAQSGRMSMNPSPVLRGRPDEDVVEEESDPKDAFLEKLRLRKEAREEHVRLSRRIDDAPHTPHAPVHLSIGGEKVTRPVSASATRLAKFERPREDGNVVRLSRK